MGPDTAKQKIQELDFFVDHEKVKLNVTKDTQETTRFYLGHLTWKPGKDRVVLEILDKDSTIASLILYPVEMLPDLPPSPKSSPKTRVALHTLYKGPALLPLWIAYHAKIGFSTFFLYNNNDTFPDNLLHLVQESLLPSITIVNVFWPIPKRLAPLQAPPGGQVGAQNHALQRFLDVDWTYFSDLDEYLIPKKSDTIDSILSMATPEIGTLCVASIYYGCTPGTSIHWTSENFITELIHHSVKPELNGRNKCFIRPKHVDIINVHRPALTNSKVVDVDWGTAWMGHFYPINRPGICKSDQDWHTVKDARLKDLWTA